MRTPILAAASAALLLAGAVPSAAQQRDAPPARLLTFTEVTHTGKTYPMGSDSRAVDVNSRIRIAIDRNALMAAAGGLALPDSITRDIVLFTRMLRAANENLERVRTAEASYAARPAEAEKVDLMAAYRALGADQGDWRREASPAFLRKFDNSLDRVEAVALAANTRPTSVEVYATRFAVAARHLQDLQGDVERIAARSGVSVRMGAWLMTNAGRQEVHLPGFDTVTPQEASVVPTYQLILTTEQAAQLQALREEAATAKRNEAATPFAGLNAWRSALRTAADQGVQCVTTARDNARAAGLPQTGPFVGTTNALVQQWESLRTRYAAGAASAGDLAAVGADAAASWKAVQDWLKTADLLRTSAPTTVPAAATAALQEAAACRAQLETSVVHTLAPIMAAVQVGAGRDLATEGLEFSDKVLSLDLGSVPETTELSLMTAGARSPGDQLVLRFSATGPDKREKLLASETFLVERAEPHIHLSVAMIWAHRDPDEAGAVGGKNWHPAPGYSILLKRFFWDTGLARRHPGYAEVLNPGLGINLSAPDFNLDDTPEFAVGIVGSVFRDYLQGGVSYNLQHQTWFPFFGIRLPLPSSTLPAVANDSGAP